MWRDWDTRTVQVRVGATPWRFKSSHPHSRLRPPQCPIRAHSPRHRRRTRLGVGRLSAQPAEVGVLQLPHARPHHSAKQTAATLRNAPRDREQERSHPSVTLAWAVVLEKMLERSDAEASERMAASKARRQEL